MNTTIAPVPGRIVWFYGSHNSASSGFTPPDAGQPLAAMVTRVWTDTMVNLTVFDSAGVPHARTSVPLLQGDAAAPEAGYYCEWMPFQKGQVAKAEKQDSVALPVDPQVHFYSPPTQRALLESSLVSGAAAHLAANPAVAEQIGAAIKKVLDTLQPETGCGGGHARDVLYPAIGSAMDELETLHAGFNDAVNRAYNHLHRAFWSEAPAPASAPGLRHEVLAGAEPAPAA